MEFCPDAVVWGTVANWVSGIATFFAACVALFVASWNFLKDRRENKENKTKEAATENALLVECLDMFRSIKLVTQSLIEQIEDGEASFDEWKYVIGRTSKRAQRLQGFPGANLRAVNELEAIVTMERYVKEMNMMQPEDFQNVLASIVYQCKHENERIRENPNPAAPLNW